LRSSSPENLQFKEPLFVKISKAKMRDLQIPAALLFSALIAKSLASGITWSNCTVSDPPELSCGTLEVPLNWAIRTREQSQLDSHVSNPQTLLIELAIFSSIRVVQVPLHFRGSKDQPLESDTILLLLFSHISILSASTQEE
jgi:hypothetical protein